MPPAAGYTPVDYPVRILYPTAVTPISRNEPFVFRWDHPGVEGQTTYTVKVLNQTMTQMWQSEKTRETELIAPAELRRKLYPGEGFWWRVVAKPDDGKRVKSNYSLLVVRREPIRSVDSETTDVESDGRP